MKIRLVFLLVLLITGSCNVSKETGSLPLLKVSENGRSLVTEKGDPFFWLGDTGWLLINKLSLSRTGIG